MEKVQSPAIRQLNSGELAAGSRIKKRDHEVEVPSCEGRAKDFLMPLQGRGWEKSENRVDQRMPLEPVTGSLLPSKASVMSAGFEVALRARGRKPHSDVWQKVDAVIGPADSSLGPGARGRAARTNGASSFGRHAQACLFILGAADHGAEDWLDRKPVAATNANFRVACVYPMNQILPNSCARPVALDAKGSAAMCGVLQSEQDSGRHPRRRLLECGASNPRSRP